MKGTRSVKAASRPRTRLNKGGAAAVAAAIREDIETNAAALPQVQRPAHTSRRQLTAKLFGNLCADFEANGADAIRACREEQPQGYLRLIASLLPKELDPKDNPLKDLLDDELNDLIEFFRGRLARRRDAGDPDQREQSASH